MYKQKTHIHNEKEVTPEQILDEADIIWAKVRSAALEPGDEVAADECMTKMRAEHRDFCTAYPLTLRYMCCINRYTRQAMAKYLAHITEHPYTSEQQYLDAMAEYVVILYQDTSAMKTNAIKKLRKRVRASLAEEHETFKDSINKISQGLDSELEGLSAESRSELAEFIKKAGPRGLKTAEVVRIESDTPSDNLPVVELHSRPK